MSEAASPIVVLVAFMAGLFVGAYLGLQAMRRK